MKTNKKGFEDGKTIAELNIDITREFVVVKGDEEFNTGDILKLKEDDYDDDDDCPRFKRVSDGKERCMFLYELAYADEAPLKNGDLVLVSDRSIDWAMKDKYLCTFIGMDGDSFICEYEGNYDVWKYAVKVKEEPKEESVEWKVGDKYAVEFDGITTHGIIYTLTLGVDDFSNYRKPTEEELEKYFRK